MQFLAFWGPHFLTSKSDNEILFSIPWWDQRVGLYHPITHSISSNVGRRSKVIPRGCVWKWRRPSKIQMSIEKRMIDQEMEIEWGTHGYPWYPIRRLTLMCVPTTTQKCLPWARSPFIPREFRWAFEPLHAGLWALFVSCNTACLALRACWNLAVTS